MPIIITAAVVSNNYSNIHRRGGSGKPPQPDDLRWMFGIIGGIFITFAVLLIVTLMTESETKVIVDAKVISAFVEPPRKGNGYKHLVNMKLEANGHQWVPNETFETSRCPTVMYNTVKPIYIITTENWLNKSSRTVGLITFCK